MVLKISTFIKPPSEELVPTRCSLKTSINQYEMRIRMNEMEINLTENAKFSKSWKKKKT